MTPSTPLSNRVLVLSVAFVVACGENRPASAPHTEFIVAAGDSTYWVRSNGDGIKLRGSPMILARLDGRFRELYVVDDDRSYESALFVGQRLYARDLESGDSTEIFRDTLVTAMAERYARRHPEARRLGPEEDPGEEPAISATAEVTVLGVHGPYLSIEYHVDTSGVGDEWHMTRQGVIDLRSGRPASLAEVLGPAEAGSVIARARQLFQETVDSVRRDQRPQARRAAQSLGHFRFDANSFSLTAPNGSLMVAFSAPGQGRGGEGMVLPIRPLPVSEPSWWTDARSAVPTSTREREEQWARGTYAVKAVYDTLARPVRLVLLDSAGHEFAVGGVNAPVHRIYWLDRPPLDGTQRQALSKAFDEAALYDDAARASLKQSGPPVYVARR
jgi:hypothetical protein